MERRGIGFVCAGGGQGGEGRIVLKDIQRFSGILITMPSNLLAIETGYRIGTPTRHPRGFPHISGIWVGILRILEERGGG